MAESDSEEGIEGRLDDDLVVQGVVVRDCVTSVVKFSKMADGCSAETGKRRGEHWREQGERAEPHWSPSNECVSIYGEKFHQLLEWAQRKARERAEREQNGQNSDTLHSALAIRRHSFEQIKCSGVEEVPKCVKEWVRRMWEHTELPRTWLTKSVAAVSLEELAKGEVLNGSDYVHLTHGSLVWKQDRLDVHNHLFLMCKLKGTNGKIVLFFIFADAAIQRIRDAPLYSTIGLCGLQTCPKRGYLNRAYSITDRQPGQVAVLERPNTVLDRPKTNKGGRPRGSSDKGTHQDLSRLQWSADVVKIPGPMTWRLARDLAKKLKSQYQLTRTLQPTRKNIYNLWHSSRADTRPAPTKRKQLLEQTETSTDTTKKQRITGNPLNPIYVDESCGGDLDQDFMDDVENHERVRDLYADWLAHVWLRDCQNLCPVYTDNKENIVFCIPSMNESPTASKMMYDKEGPVFIHIGKKSNGQCAVECSNCDPPSGFWPRNHYCATRVSAPSLGFQTSERVGQTNPMENFKPLCNCAYALLSIPSRKRFTPRNNPNLWEVAQSLHGGSSEWPVFDMTTLGSGVQISTETTYRQHPEGWLIQVGNIGTKTCGFVKHTTRGPKHEHFFHCKTCTGHHHCHHESRIKNMFSASGHGGVHVRGGHSSESFQAVLDQYTTGAGPDNLSLKVLSLKPIPDVPELDVDRLLQKTPLASQVFLKLSEKNKLNKNQEEAIIRRCPYMLGSILDSEFFKDGEVPRESAAWVPPEGLKDKDVISDCAERPNLTTAGLFHTSGVVPVRIQCPYDGNDDAIINVDNKYLFTWELIRKYLRDLRLVQTNYNRFVLSMEEVWGICIKQSVVLKELFPVLLQTSVSSSEHLKSLKTAFSHAVHGYITLLNIDWNDMYRCRCDFSHDSKAGIVYDNACNLTNFVLFREPNFLNTYSMHCDPFHHEHGSSGKGHTNCGPGTNVINAGSFKPELVSANLIEQKNSRLRSIEALVSSECQPRMLNTTRYWHAQENKVQLARLQWKYHENGKLNDLTQIKPHALFGVDAINLPQAARHSFLCRPWEHPPDGCERRWSSSVSSVNRQMIHSGPHRTTLSSMLDVTPTNDFKTFEWKETHKALVLWLREHRATVLWLIRLECKDSQFRIKSPSRNTRSTGRTMELWTTPDNLDTITVGTIVRFSSECKIVRNVLKNWSARNPEVQFLFPICMEALKTVLAKATCTCQDLYAVRESSGQHVRDIVDFDLNDPRKVLPSPSHAFSLSDECRGLLKVIVEIVDCSLKTTSKRVDPQSRPPLKRCLKNPESESWLVTGEFFPNNPVRKNAGKFLSVKRYSADEKKDGRSKSLREISKSSVCNKKVYERNNLKPGLLTVHCLYCCVCVGFSFLEQPETLRTCFKLFWLRKMVRGEMLDACEEESNGEGCPDDESSDQHDNASQEEGSSECSQETSDQDFFD